MQSNRAELAEQIAAEAYRLGFDLVGIVPAEPAATTNHYQSWLEQGYHGDMAYLARPDATAIVHTHSRYATTLAASKMRCGIPAALGEIAGYLERDGRLLRAPGDLWFDAAAVAELRRRVLRYVYFGLAVLVIIVIVLALTR